MSAQASDAHVIELLHQVQPINPSYQALVAGGGEVIESDTTSVHSVSSLISSKLRPNDKVSVVYQDGRIRDDVKYKIVKDDLAKGLCRVITS